MTERFRIDNLHTRQLSENNLALYRGWGHTVLRDLVAKSTEQHILKYTPNDAARRFLDMDAALGWVQSNDRTLYTLYDYDDTRDLAGVIWYSHSPRGDVDADYTFAIRMYESSRGKKLAQGFMRAAHADWAWHNRNQNVWLETDTDNMAARHLYEQFGYKQVGKENGRVTMLYNSRENENNKKPS